MSMNSFILSNKFQVYLCECVQPKEGSPEEEANKTLDSHNHNASMMTYSDCEEDDVIPMSNVVNKRTYKATVNFDSNQKGKIFEFESSLVDPYVIIYYFFSIY